MNGSRTIALGLVLMLQAAGVAAADLHQAARSGDIQAVEQAVAAGVDVDQRDEAGQTALILAAYYRSSDVVTTLLAAGADPRHVAPHTGSALMAAAIQGDLPSLEVLLGHPAVAVDDRNEQGQTALMFAALFGQEEALYRLLDAGANPAGLDRVGRSALSVAAGQGNAQMLARLEAALHGSSVSI